MPIYSSHHRCWVIGISLFISLFAIPTNGADSELRVFSALALQEKTSQFTVSDTPVDSTQTTYNFLLGVAFNRFYLLAETENPFSQDITVITDPTTPRQLTIEREDSSLTAGYNLWRSLNLFIGRKIGTTTLQIIPTGASSEALEFKYKEKGHFIGMNYSFDFDAHGQLSLSLAYADLPTTLTRRSLRSGSAESTKGDTTGTSYGVKWTGQFTQGVDYSVGYKQSNYRFDDETQTLNNSDSQTKQTYKTFFVGLSKVF